MWTRTLSLLSTENQKSSIESLTKRVLSNNSFANGIPTRLIGYFCEIPDSLFQIIEPELQRQSKNGNSTAMRIIASRTAVRNGGELKSEK